MRKTKTAVTTTAIRTVATTIDGDTMRGKKHRDRVLAPTKRALSVFNKPSDTDVNGSYTGKPKNKNEVPVQDADDL